MNLVSLACLERNPTVKTGNCSQKGFGESGSTGFLVLSTSQAADMLLQRFKGA